MTAPASFSVPLASVPLATESETGFLELPFGLIEYSRHTPKPDSTARAAGTVIVLLHEGLGSVSQWGGFPAALADYCGLPVFTYSRPGYGKSGPVAGDYPLDYLTREATEVLPAVLTAAGITRPVLFGHSDGATIALLYAAAFPDSPVAAIMEAPHVFVEDMTVTALAEIAAPARASLLIERLARHHDDAEGVFWRWNRCWLNPAFRTWRITEDISAIRCPLLLVQGEGDEYASLDQIAAISAAVMGASPASHVEQLILADCRHTPHRDQRPAVLAATKAFLQKLP